MEVVTILTMMFHSLLSRCAPKREAASPQLPLLQASSSSKGMTKCLGERSGGEREREAAIRQQLNQPLPDQAKFHLRLIGVLQMASF